jgi:hypothetical protein
MMSSVLWYSEKIHEGILLDMLKIVRFSEQAMTIQPGP